MLNKKIYCMPWDGMIFSIKEEDIPYFDVSKTYHKGDLIKINGEVKVIIDFVEANPSETVMESASHFECVFEFKPETIELGGKLWMAENLAYDDGEDGITYNPNNNEYYYTWNAAKRVAKKLGWKLPSDEDWNKACEACGGIKDDYDDELWYTYNNCSLKKKLNIKLAGFYNDGFYGVGSYGYFWPSSEFSSSSAWRRGFFTSSSVTSYNYYKTRGFSVRLVKDI